VGMGISGFFFVIVVLFLFTLLFFDACALADIVSAVTIKGMSAN
jgi:hypothetical protein